MSLGAGREEPHADSAVSRTRPRVASRVGGCDRRTGTQSGEPSIRRAGLLGADSRAFGPVPRGAGLEGQV